MPHTLTTEQINDLHVKAQAGDVLAVARLVKELLEARKQLAMMRGA